MMNIDARRVVLLAYSGLLLCLGGRYEWKDDELSFGKVYGGGSWKTGSYMDILMLTSGDTMSQPEELLNPQ
jgi:hypothetical protein